MLTNPNTLGLFESHVEKLAEVVHAAGGLLVLLVLTILSVYKPRGMTRYGARRQSEERGLSAA